MANQTITGKIFQLKDPTGTYNRFPRTVMEAVYGLNQYLQNQFGALADIYMPIEGITESKPGQEFVFRKSPATIPAKSLTLDRIKGKSLPWNQRLEAFDSVSTISAASGSSGRTYAGNGEVAITINSSSSGSSNRLYFNDVANRFPDGHKVIWGFYAKSDSAFSLALGYTIVPQPSVALSSSYKKLAMYVTTSGDVMYWDCLISSSSGGTFTIKDRFAIDLTLMFGEGKEPSTVEEFEAMFPGYHDYTPGELISNDAKSLETVGFNQWDDNAATRGKYVYLGVIYDNDAYCVSDYIQILPNTTYYLKNVAGSSIQNTLCLYDAEKNAIGMMSIAGDGDAFGEITLPAGCAYIRVNALLEKLGSICINISDPDKNGTYEPYRKSVLPLNLDDFWVKNGQGNRVHITGGLKSAGSDYDEIVGGNKLISRVATREYQSGDERNSAVTTDGHEYTNYALATPVEYELVEPLVPTMTAGATEARISPNADGLSAPFCADITYDANANNDAASSIYAMTAGKLQNTHKLWGQDFDGTQDVSGALTGVPNINSLLYLGSTNVGIGQSNPQYKLDVAGTLRATGATTLDGAVAINNTLTVGTASANKATTLNGTLNVSGLATIAGGMKLTTTKKIWFGDTYYIELKQSGSSYYLETNAPVVSTSYVTAGAANTNA